MTEKVHHPAHYNQGQSRDPDGTATFEAIKVWDAWGYGYPACMANVLKYIQRAPYKEDARVDLEKALVYLGHAFDLLQAGDLSTIIPKTGKVMRAEDVAADWGLDMWLTQALLAMFHDVPEQAAYFVREHIRVTYGE